MKGFRILSAISSRKDMKGRTHQDKLSYRHPYAFYGKLAVMPQVCIEENVWIWLGKAPDSVLWH
jgi:hypothetical protein